MNGGDLRWMNHVVELAGRSPGGGMAVGAALVTASGDLVASAASRERGNRSWPALLAEQARPMLGEKGAVLFLTTNSLAPDGSFELRAFLESADVSKVILGLPDPGLHAYRPDDPVRTLAHVERFPDDLQRRILAINHPAYEASEQSITCNPHFTKHRIGETVRGNLESRGFSMTMDEINSNREKKSLATFVRDRFEVSEEKADEAVFGALSSAFGVKYGNYAHAIDSRSVNQQWVDDFWSIYLEAGGAPIVTSKLLNVGVGGGQEATAIFANCQRITFVDIAEQGLHNIKTAIPAAEIVVSSADNMSSLKNEEFDVYISLRTFNSAFFDIDGAAREAKRLLKPGGLAMVSVANGFLYEARATYVVPGLIVPGTQFVDLYRGFGTAGLLAEKLRRAGFSDVRMTPTSTEIYLTATAN